ncbi:MAG: hypothetical protein ACYC23_24340, partial [Limisphaerales bacterium]
MNNPPNGQQTLERLRALRRDIQAFSTQAQTVEAERTEALTQLERQRGRQIRTLSESHLATLTSAGESAQSTARNLELRHDQRDRRIQLAAKRVKDRVLGEIAEAEARIVFIVQRDLLQTTRDRDGGKQAADTALASFETELAETQRDFADFEHRLQKAFRGYRAFRRYLDAPPPASTLPRDEHGLLEEFRSVHQRAEERLSRFRRSLLPWIFGLIPAWLLGLVVAVGHAAAVPLLPLVGGPQFTWSQAGLSLSACLFAIAFLHGLGRGLAGTSAKALAEDCVQGRELGAISGPTAMASHRA